MIPHDSRKMFAELVHSGQNDTMLDHVKVQSNDMFLMPMGLSFWQASIFLVSART